MRNESENRHKERLAAKEIISEEEWVGVAEKVEEDLGMAMRETISENSIEYSQYMEDDLPNEIYEQTASYFDAKYGENKWEY